MLALDYSKVAFPKTVTTKENCAKSIPAKHVDKKFAWALKYAYML